MIYLEQPIFLLFPIVLLLWQVFLCFFKKRRKLSTILNTLLDGIGVLGHAVAITLIFLNNGTLSDALLLVLLSSAVSLFLSPTPNKKEEE